MSPPAGCFPRTKVRRSFPSGQTTASKLKALVAALDASRGAEAGDRLLTSLGTTRADLDDETRRLPLTTFHAALELFAAAASRESIADTWRYLIADDNLGVWMRAIRGTRKPEEAFSRIDGGDSEYGRTSRWETFTSRPGFWRGRVVVVHDPALEEDGLLGLSRIAELSSVPALYGFGQGKVTSTGERAETAVHASQTYEVRWKMPDQRREVVGFGALGLAVGAAPLVLWPSILTLVVLLALIAAGALGGSFRARERERRRESSAQAVRVQALERSLRLREQRDGDAGNLQGQLVAGQYKLAQRMGAGASGVIYEATRVGDGVPVAIKLLRAAAAHDAVASDRLRREAEALGLSWHPNVVELIDHGHLPDGTAYLVMELLRGETLATRLRTVGRIPTSELLPLALQVGDALAAIHAAGVVHRDIKPSNIFLLPMDLDNAPSSTRFPGVHSMTEQVKVLDFGIARVEWEETRITNMGAPVGTPGYMSPEQEAGGPVDARSDVFAFGALLYECLTGEPPSASPEERWRTGEGESIAPPAGSPSPSALSGVRAARTPNAWRQVIDRSLAQAPDDRYPDARAMSQALRALQEPAADTSSRSLSHVNANADDVDG
jgi:serine/threonine protein kinase